MRYGAVPHVSARHLENELIFSSACCSASGFIFYPTDVPLELINNPNQALVSQRVRMPKFQPQFLNAQ